MSNGNLWGCREYRSSLSTMNVVNPLEEATSSFLPFPCLYCSNVCPWQLVAAHHRKQSIRCFANCKQLTRCFQHDVYYSLRRFVPLDLSHRRYTLVFRMETIHRVSLHWSVYRVGFHGIGVSCPGGPQDILSRVRYWSIDQGTYDDLYLVKRVPIYFRIVYMFRR